MGVIFYLSDQSSLPIDGRPDSNLLHVIAHIISFSLLGLFLALGTDVHARGRWRAFWLASLYGLIDELHQSLVPGRHAKLSTVLLNVASAGLALTFVAWMLLRSKQRQQAEEPSTASESLVHPGPIS